MVMVMVVVIIRHGRNCWRIVDGGEGGVGVSAVKAGEVGVAIVATGLRRILRSRLIGTALISSLVSTLAATGRSTLVSSLITALTATGSGRRGHIRLRRMGMIRTAALIPAGIRGPGSLFGLGLGRFRFLGNRRLIAGNVLKFLGCAAVFAGKCRHIHTRTIGDGGCGTVIPLVGLAVASVAGTAGADMAQKAVIPPRAIPMIAVS